MDPAALDHVIAGRASAEQAHQRMLGHLNKDAIIQMNMRLGRGSGAATALGIVKAAWLPLGHGHLCRAGVGVNPLLRPLPDVSHRHSRLRPYGAEHC